MLATGCPCGSGLACAGCCGRLHRGVEQAATAERLMRARYAAYAVGELDYVFRTWHPRTRPERIEPDVGLAWTGLRVVDATAETVTFVASWVRGGVPGELGELSRFEQRRGRWVYVDGDRLAGSDDLTRRRPDPRRPAGPAPRHSGPPRPGSR